jgi:hypothetical protein
MLRQSRVVVGQTFLQKILQNSAAINCEIGSYRGLVLNLKIHYYILAFLCL